MSSFENLMNKGNKLKILSLLMDKPKGFILEQVEKKQIEGVLKDLCIKIDLTNLEENNSEGIVHDYTYLFVGASAPLASPYASSYYRKDSRLMDKPARDIIRLMKKWGVEMSDDTGELPDHLKVILSFLGELYILRSKTTKSLLVDEIEKDIKSLEEIIDGFIYKMKEKVKENQTVIFYSIILDVIDCVVNSKGC